MTLHIGEDSSFAQLIDIANNLHLYTESIPDLEFNTIRKNLMRHSDDISSFLSTFPPLFSLKTFLFSKIQPFGDKMSDLQVSLCNSSCI